MSTENEKDPAAEKAQAGDRPDQDITRGITRFAQYTSPVMLAMLASELSSVCAAKRPMARISLGCTS